MSKRRKFNELTDKLTPEDRKIAEEKKAKIRASLQRPDKPSEFRKSVPQAHVRKSHASRRS